LARLAEAQAIAAGTADGPKAIPTLTRIMRWHLDRADAEMAKPGGDDAIITAALAEARLTAAALAPYQSPRLSAVAVGQVTKMTVQVIGGIPARPKSAIAPPTQIEPPRGDRPSLNAPVAATVPAAEHARGPLDAQFDRCSWQRTQPEPHAGDSRGRP
jgi:hypothetical protein